MFILANFVIAIASVLSFILWLYLWLVIARAILSWVNPDPHNPIVRFLYNATEPLLRRVRGILPFMAGGIDLSPLLVIAGIYFLDLFLVASLRELAVRLR